MRATIYARISSDREGAGLGVQRQEADCRELASTLGWTVASVHTDNDVSAYSGKVRPGYRAMLEEIRAGAVEAVLAWHADRLHRSPIELEAYVEACEAHGIATYTVRAGRWDLSTPSGRLVARQLGSVARYEVEHMVERQRRAKLQAATEGRWKGGRRPYGYADNGIELVDVEATAVREASLALLAGTSLRGLAAEWNAAGRLTTTGKPWTANALRRVLLRPRNAGLMEHQGSVVGAANWLPILPDDQWRAVVAFLTDPSRTTTTGGGRKWLGSGLYVCGVCKATLIGTRANSRRCYRCRAGHVSRTLAELDELVENVLVERLRRPDAADLLASATGIDTASLEARALTLRARLDQLAGMFARGDVDAQQLAEGTRDLRAQLESVHKQIAGAFRGNALSGIAGALDPGQVWLSAPLDRKRAVLAALVTVTVLKGAGGRPSGWRPGESYFRHDLIDFVWA